MCVNSCTHISFPGQFCLHFSQHRRTQMHTCTYKASLCVRLSLYAGITHICIPSIMYVCMHGCVLVCVCLCAHSSVCFCWSTRLILLFTDTGRVSRILGPRGDGFCTREGREKERREGSYFLSLNYLPLIVLLSLY